VPIQTTFFSSDTTDYISTDIVMSSDCRWGGRRDWGMAGATMNSIDASD